ncbi:MAG: prenyltransferase/squalene oxidase repeat-containing protein [Cyclobacteriaceae bacterium]
MEYSRDIEIVIDRHQKNGGLYWSREDGDIHAPHGSSTMDTLEVLGELGANTKEYPFLSKAIDFVFEYQSVDGAFYYSRKSSRLPCMTARILAALGRLGAGQDKRAEKSYLQLLDTQWPDGGWRCNTVKLGKSSNTDASNPGTTLYVLDAFLHRKNSPKEIDQLNRGVEFLLHHWETREPLGPCDFGMGSRFFQIEFPFLRYNLFYYVYVLSFYKHAWQDQRFKDVCGIVSSKLENGKIIPENPHRAWRKFDFARTGQVSELATKYWNEIIANTKGVEIDASRL